jgi:hypothetical protein
MILAITKGASILEETDAIIYTNHVILSTPVINQAGRSKKYGLKLMLLLSYELREIL